MAAKPTFGKRGPAVHAPVTAAAPRPAFAFPDAAPPPTTTGSALDAFHDASVPVLTIGLVLLLIGTFAIEIAHTTDFIAPLSPSADALEQLGGVNGRLVFGEGQVWRMLTAPLLHGDLGHLIGNIVALLMAGFFLERLIGGPWFIAAFILAALGGSAGSLADSDPNIVSVGASGAIMGIMVLAFLLADRAGDAKRTRWARLVALRIGIPALAPAFFSGGAASQVDYGAHFGGFLTGILVWLLLGLVWRRDMKHPPLNKLAAIFTGGGSVAALASLAIAMATPAPPPSPIMAALVPSREWPRGDNEALKRSAELVERWPEDPRARYVRALYFLGNENISEAAEQLRRGIDLMPRYKERLSPDVGYRMTMTLALIVRYQGDLGAARSLAQDACAARSMRGVELRDALVKQEICT